MRFNLLTQSLHNALAMLTQAKPTKESGLSVSIIQGRTVQAVGSTDTGKIPFCGLNTDEQVIICKLLGMDAQPLPAEDSAVQDAYISQVEKCSDLQIELEQSRANFAEAQCEVSALNRTIEKLRNLSQAQQPTQEPAPAPAPHAPRVFAFCVSFPQGMQTKTLARAGVGLEQLRALFKFKFADSKEPTKGGRWEPITANDEETRKLASLLVSHGAVSSMSSQVL